MPRAIIVHLGNDRNGSAMRQMMQDGAFPPRLTSALDDVFPDVFPFDEKEHTRDMCPGIGFPTHSPMHSIMNMLYATAQRPSISTEDMDGMTKEVSDVMDIEEGFDSEMKSMVLRGSTKIYNRILSDGTEIKIEISKPSKKEASLDPLLGLRKEASAMVDKKKKALVSGFRLDVDKFLRGTFNLTVGDPGYKDDMSKLISKTATTGVVLTLAQCRKNAELQQCIKKVAELTGKGESVVIGDSEADPDSEYKQMFYGEVVDTRKFKKKPFDTYSSAVKAVGKQVAEVVCAKKSGNIDPKKLKSLETFAAEDVLMGKLADRLVGVLRWKGE